MMTPLLLMHSATSKFPWGVLLSRKSTVLGMGLKSYLAAELFGEGRSANIQKPGFLKNKTWFLYHSWEKSPFEKRTSAQGEAPTQESPGGSARYDMKSISHEGSRCNQQKVDLCLVISPVAAGHLRTAWSGGLYLRQMLYVTASFWKDMEPENWAAIHAQISIWLHP
jgi:hypothetical protein